MYELAMRLEVKFQSHDLLRALVSVLRDLREFCERAGAAFVRARELAWVISEAAVGWGNQAAREWRNELSYIKFLAFSLENAP